MSYADWVRIATEIELNYASFDAFVILHGTDTMAYTSSALSFMLEDLECNTYTQHLSKSQRRKLSSKIALQMIEVRHFGALCKLS